MTSALYAEPNILCIILLLFICLKMQRNIYRKAGSGCFNRAAIQLNSGHCPYKLTVTVGYTEYNTTMQAGGELYQAKKTRQSYRTAH